MNITVLACFVLCNNAIDLSEFVICEICYKYSIFIKIRALEPYLIYKDP
jgi:hypothetical protein